MSINYWLIRLAYAANKIVEDIIKGKTFKFLEDNNVTRTSIGSGTDGWLNCCIYFTVLFKLVKEIPSDVIYLDF